jgi:dTDP-4-amino-4,6-dideoxygalactose transaminase
VYNQKQINLVKQVLKKNKTNYWTGNECKNFEKEFSIYHKNKYSIAVSNGSVALEMALKVLKLKKNDKVIVTSRSFIISASCTLNLGLKPIFADVNENGNLCVEEINKVYNKNVKAIILVHLNGLPCDMDPILKFAKKNKLYLIEDCSQAHGAIYKKKKIGSFGNISTWSFCQDKIISTGGEGGMVSTNDKKLWLRLWSLKEHGKSYENVFYKKYKIGFKWLHDNLGSNYRMTEMQATIGRQQLKLLNKQIKKRNFIANLLMNKLRPYYENNCIFKKPNFKCKTCPVKKNIKCNQCVHAFYRLNLFINKNQISQTKLLKRFYEKKINCNVGSCPEIYREKIFKKLNLHPKLRLPTAKIIGETSIAFPINPHISLTRIRTQIKLIRQVLKKYLVIDVQK